MPSRNQVIAILIASCIAMVITYLITGPWIIKPMFKAESIIFVPLTIPTKQIEQQGIGFASDREIDGHIQILKSGVLLDSLIEGFDLYSVYSIDRASVGGRSRLYNILNSRIKIEKTRYNSVSVVVRDQDAVRASEMANTMIRLGDKIKEALLAGNRQNALDYSLTLYHDKEVEVLSLERKIDSLEQIKGTRSEISPTLLSKYKDFYNIAVQELASRRNHLEREQKNFETALPTSYVITHAYAADRPSWPPRFMLSLAAFFAVIVFGLVVFIFRRDA